MPVNGAISYFVKEGIFLDNRVLRAHSKNIFIFLRFLILIFINIFILFKNFIKMRKTNDSNKKQTKNERPMKILVENFEKI